MVKEAHVHGVSTRKVDDQVHALGGDAGISKSEASRLCEQLDEEMAAFRERPLSHLAFPYLLCDATYVKARVGPCVVSRAVVVSTGISAEDTREVLGIGNGDSDDAAFWTQFQRDKMQISSIALRRASHKARGEVGRTDLHFHDLLHTGLTLAASTGATTAELMRRAGHTSPDAALRYQHANAGPRSHARLETQHHSAGTKNPLMNQPGFDQRVLSLSSGVRYIDPRANRGNELPLGLAVELGRE